MSIKTISAMAIAGLMATSVVATTAQDAFVAPATAEEALAMRKALMREDGALMRTLGALSGDEAVAGLNIVLTNYTHIPAVFPQGSIVGDSRALPALWENWEEFTTIVEIGKQAAADGIAAAQAGDTTAYAAALETLGGTCGRCHQQFRAE